MNRYVAFLRGINVGGHRVKMDRLRALFEALGLGGVETFIASGNVVFHAPPGEVAALEARIEAQLERELGYEVATFIRTLEEVTAVAAHQPFGAAEPAPGHTLSVLFLRSPVGEEARERLEGLRTEADEFHARDREVYWLCRTRTSDSPVGPLMGPAVGAPGTVRNVTTVRKLAAKYAPA